MEPALGLDPRGHIDSAELRHADGKLIMFLAIGRVSKFTHVEFHDSAGKAEGSAFLRAGKAKGSAFLRNVVEVFPYKIHTVLTDNGMAFADLPKNRDGPTRRYLGPQSSTASAPNMASSTG